MAKKGTQRIVGLGKVSEWLLFATKAGKVAWEPTNEPELPHRFLPFIRGYSAQIGSLQVTTLVRATVSGPDPWLPGHFVHGLRIADSEGNALIVSSNPKKLPGVKEENDDLFFLVEGLQEEILRQDLPSPLERGSLELELIKLLYG